MPPVVALEQKMNNLLRPYGSAVTPHNETIATIILYTKAKSDEKSDIDSHKKDYLTEFTTPIKQIEFGSTTSSEAVESENKVIKKLQLDGSRDYYGVFNNFSLMSVVEDREEIVKIHQNFGGSWNAFFLSEKPKLYSFTGFFIDSKEYPYYQEFLTAYDKYLKGRKLIEAGHEMVITYDGKIVKGYLLNLRTVNDSSEPYMRSFSFTILIQKENWYRMNTVINTGLPVIRSEEILNGLSNVVRINSMSKLEDTNGIIDGINKTGVGQ